MAQPVVGGSALNMVCEAIVALEDDECLNAGL